MKRLLALLCLSSLLTGCAIGRYIISDPERSRVIRVDVGERYYFDLAERVEGLRWTAKSDDPDVEVLVDHAPGKAKVRIRIHRGFDGPATLVFDLKRTKTGAIERTFTISCFHSTGDSAFWR